MTQAQSAPENKMTDDEIIDSIGAYAVSYTHLTLPTTPYV